jgi:uncharacterized protein (DUF885 family)
MWDRRSVLKSGAAGVAAVSIVPGAFAAEAAPDAKLNSLFDAFVNENLDQSPTFATQLGLDTGARAGQKRLLDESSLAAIKRQQALTASQLARLSAVDRGQLGPDDQLTYDVVMFGLRTADHTARRYDYAGGNGGFPYIINQRGGLYYNIPLFLDSQHTIATADDASAYLARLDQFAIRLDEEAGVVRHDTGLGVVPPDFVLAITLQQLKDMRSHSPEEAPLTVSLARRTGEKKIAGEWTTRAAQIVRDKIYPALDRQIALIASLQGRATHDAGVWKLPDGDSYYRDSVLTWTTSSMTPEEIHRMGLELTADHSAKIDALMKKRGMTSGSVGQRLRAMHEDPALLYPNTDAAKEQLIADLNKKIADMRARLPAWFGVLPKADVVIRRVPHDVEAGSAGGFYSAPSLDGKTPGMYWINLRDTAEHPRWLLPTLTYHEAIPGHHLQLSIQREAKMPLIRRVSYFSSYLEGWALYAEQLADEMGVYRDDDLGRIGFLHDALFRAVRLVVDSGLHAMKWSRERAIKFYVDALGDKESGAATEIERYCVMPGQACGYMLGKQSFLAARQKAQTALGVRFDIRSFHDAMLVGGAVPLAMLDGISKSYVTGRGGVAGPGRSAVQPAQRS